MNALRAILLDIDGTLINDDKLITPFTRHEISRIRNDHDIKVILASARMPKSIRTIFGQLGFPTPLVAYSGAYYEIDGIGSSLVDIDPSIAEQYLEPAWLDTNLHAGIFANDHWYVNRIDYWTLREIRGCSIWPATIADFSSEIRQILNQGGIHKIMLRGATAELDKYSDLMQPSDDQRIKSHRSKTQLELYPTFCSKSRALQIVLSELGISFDECVAFGDSETDRDMIEAAGIGVAMNNGTESLKAAANTTTLSNNEDGVGLMLRKYFPTDSEIVPIVPARMTDPNCSPVRTASSGSTTALRHRDLQ